jgi:hypothetical protein
VGRGGSQHGGGDGELPWGDDLRALTLAVAISFVACSLMWARSTLRSWTSALWAAGDKTPLLSVEDEEGSED